MQDAHAPRGVTRLHSPMGSSTSLPNLYQVTSSAGSQPQLRAHNKDLTPTRNDPELSRTSKSIYTLSMGFFSSNELPEPRVTLQLDPSCKPAFHPGSRIFGRVFFDSPVPRQIHDVQVIIRGSTITKYIRRVTNGGHNRKVKYKDEATLRTLSQVLAESLTTTPEHRCCWDFSVTFPQWQQALLHPNPAKSPYKLPSGHEDFYATTSYQLPPSFLHSNGGMEHMAQVEYTINVRIAFDDQKQPYSPAPKILLYVPSQEPREVKLIESVYHLNSYSSSRLAGSSSKSGFSKFKDSLTKKSPSVKMSLRCSIPSSVIRGKAFPIYARLDILPYSDPSEIHIPTVNIKIASMELIPIVIYRMMRVYSSWDDPDWELSGIPAEEELVEEAKPIVLNAVPQEMDVQQQQGEKGDVLGYPATFEGRLPGSVCPNFATSNIILWYKLKVKLVADVCGKEVEHEAEARIVVLSDVKV